MVLTMSKPTSETCPNWHDHKWVEEYYGTRCEKCKMFFPWGMAPWDELVDCEPGEIDDA